MSDSRKGPPQLTLNENLAKTAIKSVQKAINTLFGATAVPGEITVHDEDYSSMGDVSGILGMVQDAVEATIVLSFHKETLFTLLSKLYGKPFEKVDNSVKQGVGELTNIIYASMKKDLNDKGHTFKMSIPSVVIGTGHSIYNVHQGKNMVIKFTVEAQQFFLQITQQNSP